ncbi:SGNH/GDSL hydrolase family protein [Bradyrhizobium sp. TZ2]
MSAVFRLLPWIIAAIAIVGFGASFSELQRMRARFGEVTQHTFHDHQDVRQFMIRAALAQASHPIIIMGDSIAEMAPLPTEIAGKEVINAGIGGITSRELSRISPRLLEGVTASLIVLATGANDVGSSISVEDYSELLQQLKRHAPRLLVLPSTSNEEVTKKIREACTNTGIECRELLISANGKSPDGIHLNKRGYRIWMDALTSYMMRMM